MQTTLENGFFIFASVTGIVWLVFAYWQIKLIRRINVVSRTQHPIPENILWTRRAAMAIEADCYCQTLRKRRNLFAIIFLGIIAIFGVFLVIYSALVR